MIYEITDTRGRHIVEGKTKLVHKVSTISLPEGLEEGNYLFHCELGVKGFPSYEQFLKISYLLVWITKNIENSLMTLKII